MVNLGESVISLLDEIGKIVEMPIIVFEDLISKGAIKEIEHLEENEEEKVVLHIIRSAGEIELEHANRKYTVVQGILNGGKYTDYNISVRTIRDWMKKYRDAEKIFGNGYVGLISARHRQGNRTE